MSSIEIIPCLSDNYAYIISDEQTNKNILVDAPEHLPIERYLDDKDMSLDFILITHHHSDHIDGINHLKLKYSPKVCLLYTSPSPRDLSTSRMPSSA